MADDTNQVELRPAADWTAAEAAKFETVLGGFGPTRAALALGPRPPGGEAELAFATGEAGRRFLSDAGTRSDIKDLLLNRSDATGTGHLLPGLFVVRFPDQWAHFRAAYQVVYGTDADLDAFFDLVLPLDDLVGGARQGSQFPVEAPSPVDVTALLVGSPGGPVWHLEVWRQNAIPPEGTPNTPFVRGVIPAVPLPSWGAIRWLSGEETPVPGP